MTRTSLTAALTAAAFTALLCAAADTQAANKNSSVDGIVVRYSQDMLNDPENAARVYDRIKFASRKACGLVGGFLNMSERTRAYRCYEQTLADVVHKIDRPMLTQLHDSKTSKVG
jgi:UrcA family protein